MAAGLRHQRATVLLVLLLAAALLRVGSAIEFGILTFFAINDTSGGFIRPEFIIGAVVDSNSLVRQAYDVYFERLNRNGGITVDGVRKRATFYAFNPRSGQVTIEEVAQSTRVMLSNPLISLMLGSGNAEWDEAIAKVCHEFGALFIIPLLAPAYVVQNHPNVFYLGTQGDQLLKGAMELLAGRGAQTVHVVSEAAAWAQEVCAAAGSFGVPAVTEVIVPTDASSDDLGAALQNFSLNQSGEVIAACVSSRTMCRRLVDRMVAFDYNVEALVITNCIEADMPYDINWQPPFNSWVIGVDSWTPNLTQSTDVSDLWDASHYLQTYNERYSNNLAHKEYAAGLNAAWLLMRAMDATASQNVTELIGWLSTMEEETDHGSFSFDSVGQVENRTALTKQFVKPNDYAVLIDGAAGVSSSATLTYPKPEWQMVYCIGDLAVHTGLLLNESTGERSCTDCPVSMASKYKEKEDLRYCAFCEEGSYPYYDGDTVHCVICREGSFNTNPEARQCERCAPGKFQDEQVQTSCKECPLGRSAATSGQSVCELCPEQTYSRGSDRSTCAPCPDAALCMDGQITNKATYYLLNTDGDEITASDFFKCIHYDSSVGVRGESCQENGTCWRDENGDETMTGVLCGQCREGYGKEGITGLCKKCSSTTVNVVFAILDPFLLAVAANVMVVIVFYTDFSKPKNTWSIIAKQVLSYLQMFSVISPYLTFEEHAEFSGILTQVLTLQQFLGIAPPLIALRGANCVAAEFLPGTKSYQLMVIGAFAYIPSVITLTYYVFLIARCINRPIGGDLGIMRNRNFITVVVIYMFFLHHKTSMMFIAVFGCRAFDNKRRLLLDLETECFSPEHHNWAVAAGAGLVVYSIGIPLLFFVMLHYHNKHDQLDNPDVKNKVGFLYAGYERPVFWFESVLMLRKIAFPILVAVTLTVADGGLELSSTASLEEQEEVFNTIPLMVLVLVSLFFFGLHLICQPYDNRCYFILDRIESWSLWAILLTVTLQVFITLVKVDQGISLALFVVVFLSHFGFWALVFWGIFRRNILMLIADYALPYVHSSWLKEKMTWLFGGKVQVHHRALKCHKLSGLELESFTSLIKEIAEKHFESFKELTLHGVMGTLQCMCIEAFHIKRMEVDRARNTSGSEVVDEVAKTMRKAVSFRSSSERASPVFTEDSWNFVTDRGFHEFTVEELEMAWLNLASKNWIELQEDDEKLHGYHGTEGMTTFFKAIREGFPLSSGKGRDREETSSEDSLHPSRSTRFGQQEDQHAPPEDRAPPASHQAFAPASMLQAASGWLGMANGGESSPSSPDVLENEAGHDEGLGATKARQERAQLMQQLAEKEEENKKLQLALHVMTGMKDVLRIKIRAAQNLDAASTYYVTAIIKGKEFADKVQTQAIIKNRPGWGAEYEWNYEDSLHGYEDGDGLRFVVWAWGKTGQSIARKIGTAEMTAEEVASALAAEDHTCKKELMLERPRPKKVVTLQVEILSRVKQHVDGAHGAPEQAREEGGQNAPVGASSSDDEQLEPPPRHSEAHEGGRLLGPPESKEVLGRYRVVPTHGLKVRDSPDRTSMTLGYRKQGEVVYGTPATVAGRGEWLRLEHDLGYMLMQQDDKMLLVEETSHVSAAEMAIMATPFNEMEDHTEAALRRPDLAEADRILEVNSNASFGSEGVDY